MNWRYDGTFKLLLSVCASVMFFASREWLGRRKLKHMSAYACVSTRDIPSTNLIFVELLGMMPAPSQPSCVQRLIPGNIGLLYDCSTNTNRKSVKHERKNDKSVTDGNDKTNTKSVTHEKKNDKSHDFSFFHSSVTDFLFFLPSVMDFSLCECV